MGSKAEDTAANENARYNSAFEFAGGNRAKQSYINAMEGKEPSFAQMLLSQQTQNNVANQHALAASQRGRDPGAAMRQVMNNTAMLNQQAAGQGAMMRAQEIAQARQGLAALAGGFATGHTQASQVGGQIGAADDPWNKITQGASALGQGAGAIWGGG